MMSVGRGGEGRWYIDPSSTMEKNGSLSEDRENCDRRISTFRGFFF